ncbi:MAG TPA: DNA-primase RepB domain-containing protein [Solirubrobacteraceae bacterium]|jgi:hypothetical protein|nr:DNA-primase RepB domain-containing protein [Solirubrobacteraceae bacterium]
MFENSTSPPDAEQLAYLRLLAGSAAGARFLDVRWRAPGHRMRRRFLAATRLKDAARLLTRLACESDVYVGVALRDCASHGGVAAIGSMHLAYVESDHAQTAQRLSGFAYPPTMVVASGSPGHHQIYWLLDRAYARDLVADANRRLALALGGDPACSDAARILRPPGTLNHKHSPPRPVTLLLLRADRRYRLADLTRGLAEDRVVERGRGRSSTTRTLRGSVDRDLLAIPAGEYVRVLAGLSPNRDGKVTCPFHQDTTPSLHIYADGGFYCFGSGCRAGGSIFDFAARLWGIQPRGAGFLELRERLAHTFQITSARCL